MLLDFTTSLLKIVCSHNKIFNIGLRKINWSQKKKFYLSQKSIFMDHQVITKRYKKLSHFIFSIDRISRELIKKLIELRFEIIIVSLSYFRNFYRSI